MYRLARKGAEVIAAELGVKVPEDLFVEKQFPKGEEPRLAITEVDKLKGKMLKRSLRAGDFVTPEDLHDEKSGRDGVATGGERDPTDLAT